MRPSSIPSKDIRHDDSFFGMPSTTLLDDKDWLYVQRRYQLTDRELQVAKLVCRGFNNKDITVELQITSGTVKTHIRNIYRRARVKNKICMVLKFVDIATRVVTNPGTTPAIPIVEIMKSGKKTSASNTPKQ